jgi:molybdopterin synthase catalytic subunit
MKIIDTKLFEITLDPIDLNKVVDLVTSPDAGGVCFFTGIVRGITKVEDGDLETDHLVYEAYAPMAEKKLQQIGLEIQKSFPKVKQVALIQRIGKLKVGDIAVAVACASGHRTDGIFDAAEYGINRIKEIVPVWKQEVGTEGSIWVEGSYHPVAADNQA